MRHWICALLFAFTGSLGLAQSDSTSNFFDRMFMPSLQMGYIHPHASTLSGGLFIQTSVEIQRPSGWFIRVNYDDFDADYALEAVPNATGILRGRTSFAEFLGGAGYRLGNDKHKAIGAVQAGGRFYGQPVVTASGSDVNIEIDNRRATVVRATFGYEFALDPKTYFTLELFTSQALSEDLFWAEDPWASGFTLGVVAAIF